MTSLGLTIRQQFCLRNIVWRSLGKGGSAEESNYEVISVTMRRPADRHTHYVGLAFSVLV
jgi:hypothetical protein